MTYPQRIAAIALLAMTAFACDPAPERPDKAPPPRPAAASASAPGTASAAAPSASVAAKTENGLTGAWEGSYEAKKGTVSLPPKVKDKALAADDGKKAAGPGTVEITIGPEGDVRGKLKGALGGGVITGKAEGAMLSTSVSPDDPRAPDAMFGVLVGTIKGDVIEGVIRVAGPDATIVREAPVTLKHK
ncbi:Hypothetical protein A7982_09478 [Minicystis rosea]|nr:Hypothetical protein A7982_09478 [Minicystis rosea]